MFAALLSVLPVAAGEISSNATGGGPWSDPASWRGKVVPGPDDDVFIQKHDVIVFDRNDEEKISCRKLQIDPKGVLLFKTNAGKIVCSVAEPIETFGAIKLDGTRSAKDFQELRLVGAMAEKRKIKLAKGSALLLYGKPNLPEGKRNVGLTSPKLPNQTEDIAGVVEAEGVVMIDWQRANLADVQLVAKKLDNTGAKPNERINVIENVFTGLGRIALQSCDTPVVSKNTLENKGKPSPAAAIEVYYSPLAEIKGNTVHGGFAIGITANYQEGAVLVGNTVEKCGSGITGGGAIPNTMVKQSTIRGCDVGMRLDAGSGVIEDTVIEGAQTAFESHAASWQLTGLRVKDLKVKGQAVLNEGGTLSLLGANVAAEQVKFVPAAASKGEPIASWQYLLVAVKDAPVDCLVEVSTDPAPANGAADANVRNSPAPLTLTGKEAITPGLKTLNPLIVKGWTIDLKGKITAPPNYTIKVLGSAVKEGARPVLKTVPFRPEGSFFQTPANDARPTLEISLK